MFAAMSCPLALIEAVARPRLPFVEVASIVYDPTDTIGNSYWPPDPVNVVANGVPLAGAVKRSTRTPEPAGVTPSASNTEPLIDPAGTSTILTTAKPFARFNCAVA